jgi:acyl-homoserine-lactone acylase
MKIAILLLFFAFPVLSQNFTQTEIKRYQNQAQNVNIIRDNWGIPHVYGKTDADAVFGLLYAQCEDDFKRIELNFIEKLGRLSEIKGKASLYDDLMIRLLIDSVEAKADYQKAAPWLKQLLNAQADGINYYLYKHPEVKPILLTKFQPWYHLLWTDGSIGAIQTANITTADLRGFYGKEKKLGLNSNPEPEKMALKVADYEQTGSNGFAFAPKITESGNSILYINPHTTFYYRPEVHMVSAQGLNAYGAVTWGQMFVYQGFNQYCGWMHTSSSVDVADVYTEKISLKNNKYFYEYDKILKPVKTKNIEIRYLENGATKKEIFEGKYTMHGPIMAERDNKWVSLQSYNRAMKSLEQSWLRTKAQSFEDYKKVMYLKANTSNNTVYADNQGNIAYWHGNFVPKRDKNLNWGNDVDGSISATNWKGLHMVDETVHSYNPPNGWLQNCNSTPFTVAGDNSPKAENYPKYMAPDGENFRGINAVKVLTAQKKYTLESVISAGYSNYLAAFEVLIPALLKTYDQTKNDSQYKSLSEPIEVLRAWDYRSTESSIATTLAIEWAYKLNPIIQRLNIDEGEADQVAITRAFADTASVAGFIAPFQKTIDELNKKWGKWQIPWGEMNRFQRLDGAIVQQHADNQNSLPMGGASALWGSLASFNSRHVVGQNKRYGFNGNSFVCAVEFGKKIKAKSLLAGGNSGDAGSKHFNDQSEMYTKGIFKDVLFYKEDLLKNYERQYKPGE